MGWWEARLLLGRKRLPGLPRLTSLQNRSPQPQLGAHSNSAGTPPLTGRCSSVSPPSNPTFFAPYKTQPIPSLLTQVTSPLLLHTQSESPPLRPCQSPICILTSALGSFLQGSIPPYFELQPLLPSQDIILPFTNPFL